jgi:hypothetical protein
MIGAAALVADIHYWVEREETLVKGADKQVVGRKVVGTEYSERCIHSHRAAFVAF